jgi:hypothetical protein
MNTPLPEAETAASILTMLRDIHLPQGGVASADPTLPLAWALALLLPATAFAVWRWRRRHVARALTQLRQAITRYAADGDAVLLGSRLAGILRQHAVHRFPDDGVAGLSGAAWLRFLDNHGGAGEFEHGSGRVLDDWPYRTNVTADADDVVRLQSTVRAWLLANGH